MLDKKCGLWYNGKSGLRASMSARAQPTKKSTPQKIEGLKREEVEHFDFEWRMGELNPSGIPRLT